MQNKFLWLHVVCATIAILAFTRAADAQVVGVPLFITQYFLQTSPTEVITPDSWAFSSRVQETKAGDVTGATLTLPDGVTIITYPAFTGTTSFYKPTAFDSLKDLHAEYPLGKYVTKYSGNVNGTATVNYTQDLFPGSTPTFTATTYKAMQGMNATEDLTVNFNAFAGALDGKNQAAVINLSIFNLDTGDMVYTSGPLASTATSTVLKANTLAVDTTYNAILDFGNLQVSMDNNNVSTTVGSDYDTNMNFYTAPAAAPEASTSMAMTLFLLIGGGVISVRGRRSARKVTALNSHSV